MWDGRNSAFCTPNSALDLVELTGFEPATS